MKTIAIIPSRLGSSRFPEKPLAMISGLSMIRRVWGVACAALGAENVYVATDSERIFDHVEEFSGKAVMTSANCRNGTERVAEAVSKLEIQASCVLNVQGDSPLLPPWVLSDLKRFMDSHPEVKFSTPATPLSLERFEELAKAYDSGEVGGTFVTTSLSGRALYFSKSPIPSVRRAKREHLPLKKHIGVYAYRPSMLEKLVSFSPTPLEQVEQLEQLRALENDIDLHVVMVDYRGKTAHSVDNPADVRVVEEIIASEGELV